MDVSIIDYIGKIENGIAILMSWILNDEYHEFILWFNKKGQYKIFCNENLNEIIGVDDINNWELIDNFIIYLLSILPNIDDIFKEFDLE
jgi:hypothetical protein